MNLQSTFDIPEICFQFGVKHAVISPGSRNAALTIAFARHPQIECLSVPDERSAAFIALGLSLKTQVPTVIVCTSGSAGLNYAPAVAEAFFNQVPLLILTADRPPELIGKRDGQTIFQKELYGPHVKAYFDFPSLEDDTDQAQELLEKALNTCLTGAKGPVHLNIPFQEPFYPEKDKSYQARKNIRITKAVPPQTQVKPEQIQEMDKYPRVLIIVGQGHKDSELNESLSQLSRERNIPVVADVISNAQEVTDCIQHQDLFLIQRDSRLKPDLVISFGLSVISKNLKLFLREQKDIAHWHITPNEDAADTYDHLSKTLSCTALDFLNAWNKSDLNPSAEQKSFFSDWQKANQQANALLEGIDPMDWNESSLYARLMKELPQNTDVHLANSMAVRYANVMGIKQKDIEIYCNRGTSGIDGSNSTAVGTALASKRNTLLFTGDVAFLYDRNAFWHNRVPDQLRIVVFNNQGGNIFRMIQGPSEQPELKEFFETDQRSTALHLAEEFGFNYRPIASMEELDEHLPQFFSFEGQRSILEIFTEAEDNKKAYKQLFKKMRDLSLSN
ncbi:2-succinyl-5-enolpyruvyl-6-hydroxy-3-cyclohexene-1-carboxylic-acid synthase [Reichenbachiella ulvae]|uniref:2-succinyl-5-enolpyruvyl-6-hydroxy-3-cyclohexene-1-carboxylate synthase n=1 Tax=Reichenbachiella ulvae TaxID=2980104 RepID=A0ABT3CSB4_9BACT|nr:2-succinyl-5-enolpyruvyl-6-hydroxy-3-cyclohexene-1-carboxylic-acid synthase [Reichenbachiella ulvae]MCV9386453.1 2-succinyl-5-enolpyruvyl-6-hydroxy-3-cyclohexene-1-carboxylic-acid synthase [Reichenbachiella ulvae]